jgi:hypothetical protein
MVVALISVVEIDIANAGPVVVILPTMIPFAVSPTAADTAAIVALPDEEMPASVADVALRLPLTPAPPPAVSALH